MSDDYIQRYTCRTGVITLYPSGDGDGFFVQVNQRAYWLDDLNGAKIFFTYNVRKMQNENE